MLHFDEHCHASVEPPREVVEQRIHFIIQPLFLCRKNRDSFTTQSKSIPEILIQRCAINVNAEKTKKRDSMAMDKGATGIIPSMINS